LTKYKEPKRERIKYNIEIEDLKNQINFMKEELDKKDKLISKLKSKK
jgi:hypothetical protein